MNVNVWRRWCSCWSCYIRFLLYKCFYWICWILFCFCFYPQIGLLVAICNIYLVYVARSL